MQDWRPRKPKGGKRNASTRSHQHIGIALLFLYGWHGEGSTGIGRRRPRGQVPSQAFNQGQNTGSGFGGEPLPRGMMREAGLATGY